MARSHGHSGEAARRPWNTKRRAKRTARAKYLDEQQSPSARSFVHRSMPPKSAWPGEALNAEAGAKF